MQSHKPQVDVEFSKLAVNKNKLQDYAKKNKQVLDEQIEKLPKKLFFVKNVLLQIKDQGQNLMKKVSVTLVDMQKKNLVVILIGIKEKKS